MPTQLYPAPEHTTIVAPVADAWDTDTPRTESC